MYVNMFVGNVLDSFLINNGSILIGNCNSTLIMPLAWTFNLLTISCFLFIANYYDLKFGIIPNELSLILFVYGLIFNVFISLSSNDLTILLFSIALTSFVALISFILWHMGFWGGGDLKIFIALSWALSCLDLNYLFFINPDYHIAYFNLSISNQFTLYPKVFSILLNGILIAFIFLSLILIYQILKSKQLKYYSILSILDFKSFLNQLTIKSIHIGNLCEGMVLDKYFFNNENVLDIIDDNDDEFSNLNAYKDENNFYLSSLNRIGLTCHDIDLINDLYEKGLIENPYFQIKKGIPFMPFLTLGYIGFLIFGDFISIISGVFQSIF